MKKSPVLLCRLSALEGRERRASAMIPLQGDRLMEFHVLAGLRDRLHLDRTLYSTSGNVILPDFATARQLADAINRDDELVALAGAPVSAGRLNAMALVDEILHLVARLYREQVSSDAFSRVVDALKDSLGAGDLDELLCEFTRTFPPLEVYSKAMTPEAWLSGSSEGGVSNRELAVEELLLLALANENPAFAPFRFLFDDGSRPSPSMVSGEDALDSGTAMNSRDPGLAVPGSLSQDHRYARAISDIETFFAGMPAFGPGSVDLVTLLRSPARACPDSLTSQIEFIRNMWGFVASTADRRLLGATDLIREEETPRFPPGPGPSSAYEYSGQDQEYEAFSVDLDWMPRAVMMAKSTLVWLHQLSVRYGRNLTRLDQIPDEELDTLAARGFTVLWLIGLWERSGASEQIKKYCGNPEAAASAYALFDYEIAPELGGWDALANLRERCKARGMRLAADMVPNHTGIDSAWIRDRPELFISRRDCPYPGYSFTGPDLSRDRRLGLWLEDHYYDRTDAAVVFKRLDRISGRIDYVYHGNDGTGMAWNDTAQIDFLNPAAREAVKERILHVARNFSVIRFDAAMVLARRHIRRLWYPEPGQGGAVPSRSEHALTQSEFDAAMPAEFWREVVDMCAAEAPDTLLLAEAFWMLEGYFVRTLGMHRVYNSAFMNMLKREENAKYRETIRNTQEFDREILKRFVNFMNNPDEEPAAEQFGMGDKYFGVCTFMATMPGLPMFGHGQIEGFSEKYGMEYRRSYKDEQPDRALVARHEKEVFPILRRRALFAGVDLFYLYDFLTPQGDVDENVFAYSNGVAGALPVRSPDVMFEHPARNESGSSAAHAAPGKGGLPGLGAGHGHRALVLFNNAWTRTTGRIFRSCPYAVKESEESRVLATRTLAEALGIPPEPGLWLAARDLKTQTWRMWDCAQLREHGLEFSLEGYGCMVFADMHLLRETGRGYCSQVAVRIAARPCHSLEEEFADLKRAPLYRSFQDCLGVAEAEANRRLNVLSGTGETVDAESRSSAREILARSVGRLHEAFLAAENEDRPGEGKERKDRRSAVTVEARRDRGMSAFGVALDSALLVWAESGMSVTDGGMEFKSLVLSCVFESMKPLVSEEGERSPADFVRRIKRHGLLRKARQYVSSSQESLDFDAASWCLAFTGRPSRARLESAVSLCPDHAEAATAVASAAASASAAAAGSAAPVPVPAAALAASAATPAAPASTAASAASPLAAATRAFELALWAWDDPEASRSLGVNTWQGVRYFKHEAVGHALALAPVLSAIEAAALSAILLIPDSGIAGLRAKGRHEITSILHADDPASMCVFRTIARTAARETTEFASRFLELQTRAGYRCEDLVLLLEAEMKSLA